MASPDRTLLAAHAHAIEAHDHLQAVANNGRLADVIRATAERLRIDANSLAWDLMQAAAEAAHAAR